MSLQSSTIECVGGQSYPHYYLCNYRPKMAGFDALSASLIRFKNGRKEDLEAWTDCAVGEIRKIPYEEGTILLRALHSDEINGRENGELSLDLLGGKLGAALHAGWRPTVLVKSRVTLPLKILGKKSRQSELENVYQCGPLDDTIKRVLIIDDIVTTGTTACSIIQSMRRVVKNVSFIVFSLAKADYVGSLNRAIVLGGSAYKWQDHSWMVAEELPITTGELKEWILRDAFPGH